MAFADLRGYCAPTLLALKQAGLEYLLVDEALARAIRSGVREGTGPPGPAAPGRDGAQAAPTGRTRQGTQQRPPQPSPHASPQAVSREPARVRGEEARPRAVPREASAGPMAPLPDPGEWPVLWRERLGKTRVAPIVWTYWELGLDLCVTPDPKRRELFRDLLGDLGHSAGTHSFWPVALPGGGGLEEGKLEANAPVFLAGLRLLQARVVIVMGPQVLEALPLPESLGGMLPFQQRHYQGRLFILLPSPDALIQEVRRMQALREFLRQALAPFV